MLLVITSYAYTMESNSDMKSNVLARVMTKKGICLNILINSRDFIISVLSKAIIRTNKNQISKKQNPLISRNKSIDGE